MKRAKSILILGLTLILLGSCTLSRRNISSVPVNAQLNLTSADLDFIGEVQGAAVQSYVLGLPIGGEKYKKINIMSNVLTTYINLQSRGVNNALVDALDKTSGIDFVIPVSMKVYTDQMFLGRKDSVVVTVKTFKLKEF